MAAVVVAVVAAVVAAVDRSELCTDTGDADVASIYRLYAEAWGVRKVF